MKSNKERYEYLWDQLGVRSQSFIKSVLPKVPARFFGISINYTKHKNGYFIEEYPIEKVTYCHRIYHNGKTRQTEKDVENLANNIQKLPDFSEESILLHWRITNTSGATRLSDFSEGNKAWRLEELQSKLQRAIDTYSPKAGYIACSYCRKQRKPEDLIYKRIIGRNWKDNGSISPPFPYCKDANCAGYDQMANEG